MNYIVLLSGIGDSATLNKFGIKQIVNSPDVGKNLQVGRPFSL